MTEEAALMAVCNEVPAASNEDQGSQTDKATTLPSPTNFKQNAHRIADSELDKDAGTNECDAGESKREEKAMIAKVKFTTKADQESADETDGIYSKKLAQKKKLMKPTTKCDNCCLSCLSFTMHICQCSVM